MAADAARMPARENEFRNLVLNQRVEASTPFLAPAVWAACGDEPLDITGLSVFGGLDLSESGDLTALFSPTAMRTACGMCGQSSGCPRTGLAEKAARDHAPYDLWAEQGLSRNDARRGGPLRIYCRAPEGNFRRLSGDARSPSIAGTGRTCGRGSSKAGFSEHMLEQCSFRLVRAIADVPGGARSRNLDLGAQASAWRSSGFQHVHCQCGYRARRCGQS